MRRPRSNIYTAKPIFRTLDGNEVIYILPYNKNLVEKARELRKNMTPEEKRLWYCFFKRLPLTVKRQHNIGNYIVDFYIASKNIVVEIDGIQHQKSDKQNSDIERDEKLKALGLTVIRYSNNNVKWNFISVANDMLDKLGLSYSDLKPIKK